MSRAPTRVFLSVQPVGYRRPAGADPFTYREKRPARYRASWWTRGTTTELYRSKIVSTQEEAVRLAHQWLDRRNKESEREGQPIDTRLIDTTDHPERYGYAHEPAEKKSAAQLDAEITEMLSRSRSSDADADALDVVARNPGLTEANLRSYLRGEHGDSSALDRALAVGRAVRRGHKIYRVEDTP